MKKVILITGSSRGIGKAIAEGAYREGYTVILHGKTDSENLRKIHSELPGSYATFFDVGNREDTHQKIQSLLVDLGHIDILVNNAGIAKNLISDICQVNDTYALEEWRTNVLGSIHCIQGILPAMLEQRSGNIINIASIKGHTNLSTMSTFTYAQTKSAILSMTTSLAKTYAGQGIRVNSVCFTRNLLNDSFCNSIVFLYTLHAPCFQEEQGGLIPNLFPNMRFSRRIFLWKRCWIIEFSIVRKRFVKRGR